MAFFFESFPSPLSFFVSFFFGGDRDGDRDLDRESPFRKEIGEETQTLQFQPRLLAHDWHMNL